MNVSLLFLYRHWGFFFPPPVYIKYLPHAVRHLRVTEQRNLSENSASDCSTAVLHSHSGIPVIPIDFVSGQEVTVGASGMRPRLCRATSCPWTSRPRRVSVRRPRAVREHMSGAAADQQLQLNVDAPPEKKLNVCWSQMVQKEGTGPPSYWNYKPLNLLINRWKWQK